MPTVLRWRGYRFFFYSADGWEPPHVHVYRAGAEAKLWLQDGKVAANLGFNERVLREIVAKTREERDRLLEVWRDHFGA